MPPKRLVRDAPLTPLGPAPGNYVMEKEICLAHAKTPTAGIGETRLRRGAYISAGGQG